MSQRNKNAEAGAANLMIIIVLVLALVGGAGYLVWKNKSDADNKKQAQVSQQEQAKTAEAAKVSAEAKRIADAKAALKLATPPYMSDQLGELQYPANWKVVENPVDNVLVSMTSPTTDKDKNGNEYAANVLYALEPGVVPDQDEYVAQLKTTDASLHQDFKVTKEREVTANGMTFSVIESTFTLGSLKLSQLQAVYVEDGHAILYSATAQQDSWAIYQDIFEQLYTK